MIPICSSNCATPVQYTKLVMGVIFFTQVPPMGMRHLPSAVVSVGSTIVNIDGFSPPRWRGRVREGGWEAGHLVCIHRPPLVLELKFTFTVSGGGGLYSQVKKPLSSTGLARRQAPRTHFFCARRDALATHTSTMIPTTLNKLSDSVLDSIARNLRRRLVPAADTAEAADGPAHGEFANAAYRLVVAKTGRVKRAVVGRMVEAALVKDFGLPRPGARDMAAITAWALEMLALTPTGGYVDVLHPPPSRKRPAAAEEDEEAPPQKRPAAAAAEKADDLISVGPRTEAASSSSESKGSQMIGGLPVPVPMPVVDDDDDDDDKDTLTSCGSSISSTTTEPHPHKRAAGPLPSTAVNPRYGGGGDDDAVVMRAKMWDAFVRDRFHKPMPLNVGRLRRAFLRVACAGDKRLAKRVFALVEATSRHEYATGTIRTIPSADYVTKDLALCRYRKWALAAVLRKNPTTGVAELDVDPAIWLHVFYEPLF